LEELGVEAAQSDPGDGFWAYEFPAFGETRLRLSYNTHEGSVQIAILAGTEVVGVVVSEFATTVSIERRSRIRVVFDPGQNTALVINLLPRASFEWSLLR
jgi:hypothetical protein